MPSVRKSAGQTARNTLWCDVCREEIDVPKSWKRIPVVHDRELRDALAEVAPYYPGVAPARLVHDLTVKGAQAVVREQGVRRARDRSARRVLDGAP